MSQFNNGIQQLTCSSIKQFKNEMQNQNRIGFKKKAPYLQIKADNASNDSKQPSSLLKRTYLPAEQTLTTERATSTDKSRWATANDDKHLCHDQNQKNTVLPLPYSRYSCNPLGYSTEQRRTALILAKTRHHNKVQRTGRPPLPSSLNFQ